LVEPNVIGMINYHSYYYWTWSSLKRVGKKNPCVKSSSLSIWRWGNVKQPLNVIHLMICPKRGPWNTFIYMVKFWPMIKWSTTTLISVRCFLKQVFCYICVYDTNQFLRWELEGHILGATTPTMPCPLMEGVQFANTRIDILVMVWCKDFNKNPKSQKDVSPKVATFEWHSIVFKWCSCKDKI